MEVAKTISNSVKVGEDLAEHRSQASSDDPEEHREDVYVIVDRGSADDGLGDEGYVGLRKVDDRVVATGPATVTAERPEPQAQSEPEGDGLSDHDRARLQQSAARLRVVLDQKLDRQTPDYVKKLAAQRRT